MNLNRSFHILTWRGFSLHARYHAIWSSLLLGALLLALGRGLGLAGLDALWFSLGATMIHWFSEFWHHFGHWLAGKVAGYPMNGLLLVYVLAVGRYPQDEPDLPARVHIQRALGGPLASFLLTLAAGVLAGRLWPAGGVGAYLAAFAFLDNLLVFTLGALLPLGFTDGSTLMYWWPRRRA